VSRAGLEPATHWLKVRTVRAVPEKRYDVLTSIQPLNRHPPKLILGYLPPVSWPLAAPFSAKCAYKRVSQSRGLSPRILSGLSIALRSRFGISKSSPTVDGHNHCYSRAPTRTVYLMRSGLKRRGLLTLAQLLFLSFRSIWNRCDCDHVQTVAEFET
jgi:hypothetical protein